jgi:thiamine pyrophosphate-dependent acetolactate synthase large subunit-like protein
MGHAASGVVGLALGDPDRPALALCGDGAMLMMNELVTAVKNRLRVVWLVLNDSRYGMCRHGVDALGVEGVDCDLPRVDFAMLALSAGAYGVRVANPIRLNEALDVALSGDGPAVVDVLIDPDQRAPIGRRVQKLTWHDQQI